VLTRVFDSLKDKNGNIPIDELEGVLEQLGAGVGKQGLQNIVNELDPYGKLPSKFKFLSLVLHCRHRMKAQGKSTNLSGFVSQLRYGNMD